MPAYLTAMDVRFSLLRPFLPPAPDLAAPPNQPPIEDPDEDDDEPLDDPDYQGDPGQAEDPQQQPVLD